MLYYPDGRVAGNHREILDRNLDPVVSNNLRALRQAMGNGDLVTVRRITRDMIRWTEESCNHELCSDVRIICARALINLADDNSALELLIQSREHYLRMHDIALACWLTGCLRSLESSAKREALQSMQYCLRRFDELRENCDESGSSQASVNWYDERGREMEAVIDWYARRDQLLPP